MIWKPVFGYDGIYEVSDRGDLVRIWKSKKKPVKVVYCKRHGYGYVTLCGGGTQQRTKIHHVVLKAFGHMPTKERNQARHLDGVKANNWLSNLKWGTALENNADKVLHNRVGGACRGQKHHNAKLTNDAVKKIRVLLRAGFYQRDIAQLFGVTQSNISKIATGVSRQSYEATKRTEARL